MSSTTNMFHYAPFQAADEIRLLSVHHGEYDSTIHGDIFHVKLKELSVKYEALSYTWGDSPKPFDIHIGRDNQPLPITANCAAAIRRLRHRHEQRVVWIDAICINQEDIPERNVQVLNMADIYSQASQVVVYIGESRLDVDLGIKYLMEIGSRDMTAPHSQHRHPSIFPRKGASQRESHDHRHPTVAEIASMRILFDCPWFTRIWILQEVFHARLVTVICGHYSFDWKCISRFLTARDIGADLLGMYQIPYALTIRKLGTKPKSLWTLLNSSRFSNATDPHDKLYGILSMARDTEHDLLPIDYASDVTQVYTRLAEVLFHEVGLRLLDTVNGRSKLPGLPSWAPDWTIASSKDEIYNKTRSMLNPDMPAGGPPDWTLAELVPAPDLDRTLLKVRGVQVDRISFVTDVCNLTNVDWKSAVLAWRDIAMSKSDSIRQYPRGRPVNQILSVSNFYNPFFEHDHSSESSFPTKANGKFRVTNHDLTMQRAHPQFANLFTAGGDRFRSTEHKRSTDEVWKCNYDDETKFVFNWKGGEGSEFFHDANLAYRPKESMCEMFYRTMSMDSKYTRWEPAADLIFGENFEYRQQAEDRTKHLSSYEDAVKIAIDGRRFFMSKDGYIGLAPAEARIGDTVCVFFGGNVPYVIRELEVSDKSSSPAFELVGPSYLHGANKAEAVRHIHASRRFADLPEDPVEDFLLW